MSVRHWRGSFLALAGALLLLASACGGGTAPSGSAAPSGSPPAAKSQGPAPSSGVAATAGSTGSPASGAAAALSLAYVAPSASQAAAWVAADEGFFKQNGLNVKLIYVSGGASPTAALISGHVQAMQIATEATEADLGGAHLVYVAAPLSLPLFSLASVPSITSPSQLRGKRVGMTGYGTATYYADVVALQHFGLDPAKDVALTPAGGLPAILAAMKAGQMQAAALSMPILASAEKQGMHNLGNVASMGVRYPNSWLAVTQSFAQTHPAEVQALVKSIAQAIAFQVQHPSQTEAIIGKYTHITDPVLLKQTYEYTVPYLNHVPMPLASDVAEGLKLIALRTPSAKTADPASMVDTQFVQSLVSSGFFKTLYPGGTGGSGSTGTATAGGAQG
jgi:NitT/TauT family transport system substrate-binding protein